MSFITGIPIQNETHKNTPHQTNAMNKSHRYTEEGERGVGCCSCYGHWQHIFLSIGHDIFFILCMLDGGLGHFSFVLTLDVLLDAGGLY